MTNIRRHFEQGYAYSITTVTWDRKPVFADTRACETLLVNLEYHRLILDYKLYAYCIMPDHVHIIIHPYGKHDLSKIMRLIKGNFARKINKMNFGIGRIWQRRYYEEMLGDTPALMDKIEYIHNNPLRKGLVDSLEDYQFSSFLFYHKDARGIVNIDRPS